MLIKPFILYSSMYLIMPSVPFNLHVNPVLILISVLYPNGDLVEGRSSLVEGRWCEFLSKKLEQGMYVSSIFSMMMFSSFGLFSSFESFIFRVELKSNF